MRLHRFYIEEYQGKWGEGAIIIDDSGFVNQFKNVLRYTTGDHFIGFHVTGGEYELEIQSIDRKVVVASFVKLLHTRVGAIDASSKNIALYVSLIKKDRFEWMIEKITELGIKKVVPIISHRTTTKNISLDRLQKISREAIEQSGQMQLIAIEEPLLLVSILEKNNGDIFCFHIDDTGKLKSIDVDKIITTENKKSVADGVMQNIFIGPEGGWDENDIALFRKYHAKFVHLNTSVLRTETAAIVAAIKFL